MPKARKRNLNSNEIILYVGKLTFACTCMYNDQYLAYNACVVAYTCFISQLYVIMKGKNELYQQFFTVHCIGSVIHRHRSPPALVGEF